MKRSMYLEPDRENCSQAGRQFEERDAEGSFGAGCLNICSRSSRVVPVIEYDEKNSTRLL